MIILYVLFMWLEPKLETGYVGHGSDSFLIIGIISD